jgi:ribose-phosphate pyrophosphokinase
MITFKAKTPSGEIIKSAISDFIFPAGEAHIKVEPKRTLEPTEIAIIQPSADSIHDDLFKLAMWSNYLFTKSGVDRVLVLPYFPGARADRVSPGVEEPFGLEVYAEFIGGLMLDQIIIFDPHSEGVVRELKNADAGATITVVSSDELFADPSVNHCMQDYTGIIAPDKGAVTRAKAVADVLELPVFTAEKTRDPLTGRLSGFHIDLPEPFSESDDFYLIVDDICDGGGTFLGLEDSMGLPYGNVDLFVSHGVFSKMAVDNLASKFEYVYTTNSYNPKRDLNYDTVEGEEPSTFIRFDVVRLLLEKVK